MKNKNNEEHTWSKRRRYKKNLEDYILDTFIYIFLAALCIVTIYPFWYIVCVSLSTPEAIAKAGGIMFWPHGFELSNYKTVLFSEDFYRFFRNSIFYVAVGTAISMILTIFIAYPLSKKKLIGRKYLMIFCLITMYFSGGLIPSYLLVVNGLGWYGNILAILIPGAISTYNMIVLRSNFEQIPHELFESAEIDGADEMYILWKIVLPLAVPGLAVVALFYAVAIWGNWFSANLYLPRNRELWPLAMYLREVLAQGNVNSLQAQMSGSTGSGPQIAKALKLTTAVLTVVPILVVYPFIQKYFVKGVMLGSVKG
ncbi:MAG: carbohydrate ABC transporter permease [Lachnospirales bacterium]